MPIDWGKQWDDWGKDVAGIGATLGAGYLSYKAAGKSSDATERGFQAAAEQQMPWSGGGLFGAATFDPTTRTFVETLSPDLQAQYDDYMTRSGTHEQYIPAARAEFDRNKALGRAQEGVYDTEMARTAGAQADYAKQMGMQGGAESEYNKQMGKIGGAEANYASQMGYASGLEGDVFGAGKKFYDMQKALYAPEQERARLSQESRLLGQGRLGSTGGAGEVEALRTAQAQVDLEAQYAGLDKAQQQVDTFRGRGQDALATEGNYRNYAAQSDARVGMFNARANEGQALEDVYRGRQAADLGMVESLGLLPGQYSSLGRGLGSDQGNLATAGANAQATAAKNMADMQAAGLTGVANQVNYRTGGYSPKTT